MLYLRRYGCPASGLFESACVIHVDPAAVDAAVDAEPRSARCSRPCDAPIEIRLDQMVAHREQRFFVPDHGRGSEHGCAVRLAVIVGSYRFDGNWPGTRINVCSD